MNEMLILIWGFIKSNFTSVLISIILITTGTFFLPTKVVKIVVRFLKKDVFYKLINMSKHINNLLVTNQLVKTNDTKKHIVELNKLKAMCDKKKYLEKNEFLLNSIDGLLTAVSYMCYAGGVTESMLEYLGAYSKELEELESRDEDFRIKFRKYLEELDFKINFESNMKAIRTNDDFMKTDEINKEPLVEILVKKHNEQIEIDKKLIEATANKTPKDIVNNLQQEVDDLIKKYNKEISKINDEIVELSNKMIELNI